MSKDEEGSSIEFNEAPIVVDLDAGKPEPEADENDPRTAIYKKSNEQRKTDGEGSILGTEQTADEETADQPDPVQDEGILVKVNGKERKVPKSKIDAAGGIEAFRKNAAASELLNQAAAERRDIEATREQLATQAREIQQEREELRIARQSSAPSAEDMKVLAKQYHEAILDGEMDKASELLVQMQAPGDSNAVARHVALEAREAIRQERELVQKQTFETERNLASNWFHEECQDIASDPELMEMSQRRTVVLMNDHPDWGAKKIIEESARMTREWMETKGIGKLPVSDKMEAKRGLSVVKGGSARHVPRQASKVPTNSQYIENLRKQRGLET